jgi:hypothetical protein
MDRSLGFESANPSVVKSIKQRDLLNTWLRLYAREQRMPRVEEYRPERLADELPDPNTSRRDRSRSIPPRTRPYSGRRRNRIQLALRIEFKRGDASVAGWLAAAGAAR